MRPFVRALLSATALAALAGCAEAPPRNLALAPALAPTVVTASVLARGETAPVGTAAADAADDPAIWRNRRDPANSLIVATDKKAGLYVYGLDGKIRHFMPSGRLNNVDLIDRGQDGVLVVASDRNNPLQARLALYRLDTKTGHLASLGSVSGGTGEAYGICLWADRGALYAFSVLKEGAIEQVRIDLGGPAPTGTIVRTLRLVTQPEGCVIDPRTATLFVGEEDRGIWKFDARATGVTTATLVAPVDGTHLVADVEGLALAPRGTSGGFLIASSQGDNSYALYRLPDMIPAGRFRVAAGTFGSTEETDGIAFTPGSFGANYPGGLLIVQDGVNAPHAQNFKLVAWQDVLAAIGPKRN